MILDVSLFEAVTMQLLLHVFQLLDALLLPVELVINVTSSGRNRQVAVGQFHDSFNNSDIVNALQLGVLAEVLGNLLVGDLNERFNLLTWEGSFVLLLCLDDVLRDVARVESVLACFCLFSLPRHFL